MFKNKLILVFILFKLFYCYIEITLQNGRELNLLNGNKKIYTESTVTSITTQYIDSWNNYNGNFNILILFRSILFSFFLSRSLFLTLFLTLFIGITYFLGSTPTNYIAEESSQFRTLLKFPSIHQYIQENATILESDITISFVNWNSDAILQVCFITKPWNDHQLNQ